MRNWKALLAVLLIATGLTACTDKGDEKGSETDPVNNTPVETDQTETEDDESLSDETIYVPEVLDPDSLVLETERTDLFVNGENPYYDKANNTIVFAVEGKLNYSPTDRCSLIISGDDIYILDGELVTDNYPSLCGDGGYYGAAIKFDEALAPGEYRFSIDFSIYTISFKGTIN